MVLIYCVGIGYDNNKHRINRTTGTVQQSYYYDTDKREAYQHHSVKSTAKKYGLKEQGKKQRKSSINKQ